LKLLKHYLFFIVGHYEKTQPDPNTFERNLSPPITTKSTIEPSSQARPLKPLMIKPLRLFILYIKGEYVSLNVVFIMIDFVLWKYPSNLEQVMVEKKKKGLTITT